MKLMGIKQTLKIKIKKQKRKDKKREKEKKKKSSLRINTYKTHNS